MRISVGVCCPPGGKAQRKALKEWLMEKLGLAAPEGLNIDSEMVEGWLHELPWNDEE